MKYLPVHIITVVFLLLTACDADPIAEAPVKNEIKFNTGVVLTRGVIDSDGNHIPQQVMNDIQIIRGTDGSTQQGFVTPNIATSASIAAGSGTMLLDIRQYFDEDRNNAHFMAFYPKHTSYEQGKVSWTIDGTQDIMVTKPVTAFYQGGREIGFEFKHCLAQVVLQLVAADQASADLYGNMVSAKINVPSELELTIPDNGVAALNKKNSSAKTDIHFGALALTTKTDTSKGILIYPDITDLTQITLEFERRSANNYIIENLVLAPGYKTIIIATVNGRAVNFNVSLQPWKKTTETPGKDDEIGLGKPGESLK